jgi:hypothetical protein
VHRVVCCILSLLFFFIFTPIFTIFLQLKSYVTKRIFVRLVIVIFKKKVKSTTTKFLFPMSSKAMSKSQSRLSTNQTPNFLSGKRPKLVVHQRGINGIWLWWDWCILHSHNIAKQWQGNIRYKRIFHLDFYKILHLYFDSETLYDQFCDV